MKNHITNKAEAVERIGNLDIYHDIAHLFAKHLPLYSDQLQSALEADDFLTIKRVAHSIKSSCATIGAEQLRNNFAYIEQQASNSNRENLKKSLPQTLESIKELLRNISDLLPDEPGTL